MFKSFFKANFDVYNNYTYTSYPPPFTHSAPMPEIKQTITIYLVTFKWIFGTFLHFLMITVIFLGSLIMFIVHQHVYSCDYV